MSLISLPSDTWKTPPALDQSWGIPGEIFRENGPTDRPPIAGLASWHLGMCLTMYGQQNAPLTLSQPYLSLSVPRPSPVARQTKP